MLACQHSHPKGLRPSRTFLLSFTVTSTIYATLLIKWLRTQHHFCKINVKLWILGQYSSVEKARDRTQGKPRYRMDELFEKGRRGAAGHWNRQMCPLEVLRFHFLLDSNPDQNLLKSWKSDSWSGSRAGIKTPLLVPFLCHYDLISPSLTHLSSLCWKWTCPSDRAWCSGSRSGDPQSTSTSRCSRCI